MKRMEEGKQMTNMLMRGRKRMMNMLVRKAKRMRNMLMREGRGRKRIDMMNIIMVTTNKEQITLMYGMINNALIKLINYHKVLRL